MSVSLTSSLVNIIISYFLNDSLGCAVSTICDPLHAHIDRPQDTSPFITQSWS